MLACSSPSLKLLGVSTVACNQTVEKTTANALAVLHAIGKHDIPVYKGQAKPLMRASPQCPEIHGVSGAPPRAKVSNALGCQSRMVKAFRSCCEQEDFSHVVNPQTSLML